jgi:hypothetical protein
MQLLITTQTQENYGAHDWDGEGTCPQRWKFKGGNDYVIKNFKSNRCPSIAESATQAVMGLRSQIEEDNDYYREHIIDWRIVADDYLTDFERSQLEYEGSITYPATRLTLETA